MYPVNVAKGDRNLTRLAAQAQDHLELSYIVRRLLTQKEVLGKAQGIKTFGMGAKNRVI